MANRRKSEIQSSEIEFSHRHPDYGDIYQIECPECHSVVYLSAGLTEVWDTHCECDRMWSIVTRAVGRLDDAGDA